MPIYEYHCTACDAEFELLVRSSTVPTCPQCGSTVLDKVVSQIAPHQKIPGMRAAWRKQGAKEGHFSNFSKAEQPKTDK
jgi:putative FmdB family regulatory protein